KPIQATLSSLNKLDVGKWPVFLPFFPEEELQLIPQACVFGSAGLEVLYTIVIGTNCCGCLRLGNIQSTIKPWRLDSLSGIKIGSLSCGSGIYIVLATKDHNVYSQLGSGTTNHGFSTNLSNKSLRSHHSLMLISDGEVFAWGYNNSRHVKYGSTVNQPVAQRVTGCLRNKEAVNTACGQVCSMVAVDTGEATCAYRHTLILTDEGQAYAWGANYGQLGTGNKSHHSYSTLVLVEKDRIIEIAVCHSSHTSGAKTQGGHVYMWGQGQFVILPDVTHLCCTDDTFACFAAPAIMWRLLSVEPDDHTVAESLRREFDNLDTAVLKFVVDGKYIYAHKVLLKIVCLHVHSLLEGNEDNIVEMSEFSYSAYWAFLEFVYTNSASLSPEEAVGLLDLVAFYKENHLNNQGICEESAVTLLSTAVKYDAWDLEEFCFRFCINLLTIVTNMDHDLLENFFRKESRVKAFKN
uniref:BTB domain-containing protein n=1 Tax=Chlorocebus sabaeus TaxID=60711 RepID=A0A0D9R3D5_CHLSB